MENQHRLLTGYKEMDQEKIDLFNKITAKGQELQELIDEVDKYNIEEISNGEVAMSIGAVETNPNRWLALARTELQTGLMYLKRSLAKPSTF